MTAQERQAPSPPAEAPAEGTPAEEGRSEGTRSEGTRSEGTRSEGTRSEGTRSEGTRSEGTRSEGTRSDEGSADWQDKWRRTAADLDNLRKRQVGEVTNARERERERVAAEWLPVLDNLELALAHADSDPSSVVEGVRAVRDQAVAVLARLGYPRHDEAGAQFDPARHEVVTVVDEPGAEPGTVVRVLRPGYGDGNRMLRPVAVAVARRPE
jgi:molecular chaperone GrpE